jgi:hypothetical protein
VYLPPGVIRDRLRGGPDLSKLGFGFDPADPRQARAAAVVAAADIDSQVAVEPKRGRDLPAVTAGGEPYRGAAAVRELFTNLRLLGTARVLLFVPGVSGLVARWLALSSGSSGSPPAANGPRTGPPAPAAAS